MCSQAPSEAEWQKVFAVQQPVGNSIIVCITNLWVLSLELNRFQEKFREMASAESTTIAPRAEPMYVRSGDMDVSGAEVSIYHRDVAFPQSNLKTVTLDEGDFRRLKPGIWLNDNIVEACLGYARDTGQCRTSR